MLRLSTQGRWLSFLRKCAEAQENSNLERETHDFKKDWTAKIHQRSFIGDSRISRGSILGCQSLEERRCDQECSSNCYPNAGDVIRFSKRLFGNYDDGITLSEKLFQ